MRRFRRSTASHPISQDERRNADLFYTDLHGSVVQSEALEESNPVLSFEEFLFGAAAPPIAPPASEREEVPARSSARFAAISAKLQTLRRHLSRRKPRATGQEAWSGEDFVPTSVPGVGGDFDNLISNLFDLEKAAIKEHYSFEDRLSAFRKIFYDSDGWDIVISGAKSVKLPASWSSGALLQARKDAKALQVLDIQGKPTDIGHLLTGLDADNHPVKPFTLKSWIMSVAEVSSNKAQATYAGDLGSVCYEYQKALDKAKVPMGKAVKNLYSATMKSVFNSFASPADMGGNADAFALTLDKSVTVVQNLFDYYTAPPPAWGIHLRWYHLMEAIVGGRSGTAVSWALKEDVFSAAEAYAVGAKHDKFYVVRLITEKPSAVLPTFRELAMQSATWAIDEFLDRVQVELDALEKSLATP